MQLRLESLPVANHAPTARPKNQASCTALGEHRGRSKPQPAKTTSDQMSTVYNRELHSRNVDLPQTRDAMPTATNLNFQLL
jgi:hypothetical protein